MGAQGLEGAKLVLGQGLERKEVEGAVVRMGEQPVEDRDIVDQALARGGRGGDHDMAAGPYLVDGLHLVTVEPVDALVRQGLAQRGRQRLRQFAVGGLAGGNLLVMHHKRAEATRIFEGPQVVVQPAAVLLGQIFHHGV